MHFMFNWYRTEPAMKELISPVPLFWEAQCTLTMFNWYKTEPARKGLISPVSLFGEAQST